MISKIYQNKKIILISSMVLFFLILIGTALFPKKEVIEPVLLEEIDSEKEELVDTNKIRIDIKGAVKTPGVYELETGKRVLDAIEKSGGFLENADTNTINLSKKLEDEMVIIIYTKEEINAYLEEEVRVNKVEQTCICPKIENNACIENAVTNYEKLEKQEKEETKIVSLNHGSLEDFETLPGIGNSKAKAIITYREEHGEFHSIEEVKEVSGIGDKTFEKIKPFLTL